MILDTMELYMQLRAGTEPPPIAHRWSYLTCLSAFLARKVWLPFGEGKINTNMFTMLVGEPGARKSTAIKQAARLFQDAGYDTFAASKSSLEKFLMDLEGQPDVFEQPAGAGKSSRSKSRHVEIDLDMDLMDLDTATEDCSPRHVLIAADEFNNFMGAGNINFLSILGELWDWDNDSKPFEYRLKNSRSVRIWQPTISILGGNTPDMFRLCFPEEALGQGYMSRQLLIQCDRTDVRIAFPEGSNDVLRAKLVENLKQIGKLQGPMELAAKSRTMLEELYKTWQDMEDQRFRSYSSRRYTHLLKLCVLLAANRMRLTIEPVDVLHANTILAHAEMLMPKAMGEIGRSKNSVAAQRIMQYLYDLKRPADLQHIWKVVSTDLERISDLSPILDGLRTSQKLQVIMDGSKPMYLPMHVAVKRHVMYVDSTYLRGKELPIQRV